MVLLSLAQAKKKLPQAERRLGVPQGIIHIKSYGTKQNGWRKLELAEAVKALSRPRPL
jgi:hypothetical protein